MASISPLQSGAPRFGYQASAKARTNPSNAYYQTATSATPRFASAEQQGEGGSGCIGVIKGVLKFFFVKPFQFALGLLTHIQPFKFILEKLGLKNTNAA